MEKELQTKVEPHVFSQRVIRPRARFVVQHSIPWCVVHYIVRSLNKVSFIQTFFHRFQICVLDETGVHRESL